MTDLRSMASDLGLLSRPDGTVNYTQGDTCVMAAVYGPGEVKAVRELVDKASVEVVYKPKTGLPGCKEKLHERYICKSVETAILSTLHPRSCISIIVQEIQNSGSLLAACINASSLALLDACVNMKYQIAGVCIVMDSNGSITLDPSLKEEQTSVAGITFVFENRNMNIVTVATKGKFSMEQFHKCLMQAKAAAKSTFSFFRSAIEQKMSKT